MSRPPDVRPHAAASARERSITAAAVGLLPSESSRAGSPGLCMLCGTKTSGWSRAGSHSGASDTSTTSVLVPMLAAASDSGRAVTAARTSWAGPAVRPGVMSAMARTDQQAPSHTARCQCIGRSSQTTSPGATSISSRKYPEAFAIALARLAIDSSMRAPAASSYHVRNGAAVSRTARRAAYGVSADGVLPASAVDASATWTTLAVWHSVRVIEVRA